MELLLARTAREPSTAWSGNVADDAPRTRRGSTTWEAPTDLLESLIDAQGSLRFEEWQQANQLAIVKEGPHRTVYRIDLPSGTLYLKHYKVGHWTTFVRNGLRPCPAAMESKNAALVAEAGVSTISPLAVGWNSAGITTGESFLVVRAIENSESLHDFISDSAGQALLQCRPALRQELARQLGELAGRLHRAGLLHGDFHPGNILIQMERMRNPTLWLVDLHSVSKHRELTDRAVEENLSLLGTFFDRFSTPSDRLRFFQAYWKTLHGAVRRHDFSKRARHIEVYCQGAIQQAYRQGDRKWLRSNRRLAIFHSRSTSHRVLKKLGQPLIEEVRQDPERLFKNSKIHFWRRRTPSERLAAVDLRTAGGMQACYLRAATARRNVDLPFISREWSPLRRAWEMGHAFLRRGISTPLPLLYTQTRSIATSNEYLLTERLAGVLPLSVFLEQSLPAVRASLRETWLRAIGRLLAAQIRRMHRCDFDHQELIAENLFVASSFSTRKLWWLGLDKVHLRARGSAAHVPENLASLHRSLASCPLVRKTHRLRFLKAYLGARFEAEWKPLWKQLEQLSIDTVCREEDVIGRRAFLAASVGAVAASLSGCRIFHDKEQVVSLPARHSLKSDQLLVLSDFKLPKDHPLIKDLTSLRLDVAKSLDLELERDPVVVYLFTNETLYRQYLEATYPRLPPRRAYFVGTPTELAVYTFWGDNIQEDLRHEYTHGLLHSAIDNVPIWIDEGLAEYFEVAEGQPARVNTDYAHRMATSLGNGWRPDLKRLERIDEFSKMQQADYQESWAWVHFMLHSTPEAREALVSYLHDLKTNAHPVALSTRLEREIPGASTRFLSHLASLPQARQMAAKMY